MPAPSNPSASPNNAAPTFAPRNRLRLHKALRFIKLLGALFVLAFFCAYARTYLRYGTSQTQPQASLTQFFTQPDTPTPSRLAPRRHLALPVRHLLMPARHVKRRPQHRSPFHLATLRRIRRYLSRMLNVRS